MKSEVGTSGRHRTPAHQVEKKEDLNRKYVYWRRDWGIEWGLQSAEGECFQ